MATTTGKTYILIIDGLKAAAYTSRDAAFDAAIAADNGAQHVEVCTLVRGVVTPILDVNLDVYGDRRYERPAR